MKQVEYTCKVCGQRYQTGKEHSGPKHCKVCAEWLRDLGMGPRQRGDKDYWRLGLVVADLIKKGKLGEANFISGFVEGVRK
jgi:hypothetical protein